MEENSSVLGDALIRAQQITVLQRKSREGTSCFASKRLIKDGQAGKESSVLEERREEGSKQVILLHLKLEGEKIRREQRMEIPAERGIKEETALEWRE